MKIVAFHDTEVKQVIDIPRMEDKHQFAMQFK